MTLYNIFFFSLRFVYNPCGWESESLENKDIEDHGINNVVLFLFLWFCDFLVTVNTLSVFSNFQVPFQLITNSIHIWEFLWSSMYCCLFTLFSIKMLAISYGNSALNFDIMGNPVFFFIPNSPFMFFFFCFFFVFFFPPLLKTWFHPWDTSQVCLFDLGLTSLSTFFSHIATVSGCGRELNAHF